MATDVSGQPIGPIFEGQAVREELFLECLTVKLDTKAANSEKH